MNDANYIRERDSVSDAQVAEHHKEALAALTVAQADGRNYLVLTFKDDEVECLGDASPWDMLAGAAALETTVAQVLRENEEGDDDE